MEVAHLTVLLCTVNIGCCYGQVVGQVVAESSVSSSSDVHNSNFSVVHHHSDVHGGNYYPYETTTYDPKELGLDCIDRKGKRIPVGNDYLPYKHSPCTICQCLEDKQMMACSSIGCEVLECLSFEMDSDTCCGYTCKENGSYGSLDVRQVGKDSVIVQWSLDKKTDIKIAEISLHYSGAGYDMKMSFVHVPVTPGAEYVIVPGLKYGTEYTFTGVGKVYVGYPVELYMRAAQIILEPRVGNALKLEKQHGNDIVIYNKGERMKVKMDPYLFINMQAFDYVKVDQKTKKSKTKHMLRLFKAGSTPGKGVQMNMEFSNPHMFRWALAHL